MEAHTGEAIRHFSLGIEAICDHIRSIAFDDLDKACHLTDIKVYPDLSFRYFCRRLLDIKGIGGLLINV